MEAHKSSEGGGGSDNPGVDERVDVLEYVTSQGRKRRRSP